MSCFPLPDRVFAGINWNLVARVDRPRLPAPDNLDSHLPLAEFSGGLQSAIFAIGVRSDEAKPTWQTGGWVDVMLPAIVGSTSEFVTTKITSFHVPLRQLQVYQLPPANYPEFSILFRLRFPPWLPSAIAEIWQCHP